MKAVVAAFNQEKALVGAFSAITNLRMELFEALVSISCLGRSAWLLGGGMLGTEGRVSEQDGAALPNTASHPRLHHSPPPHSRPQPGHRDTAWRAPHPATIPPSPAILFCLLPSTWWLTSKQCADHTPSLHCTHHTQPAVHTHNWISCGCEET